MLTKLTTEGRVAVISGAGSGIGRCLALQAADRGLTVAMCDVNAAALESVADDIRKLGGIVLTRSVDVRSADAVEAFASDAFAFGGSIALVFANAGIMQPHDGLRPDLELWNRHIDINLRGTVHMVHSFMGRLMDAGEPAQFVITGSQASFLGAPTISPYVATKHALWGLAESLRQELRIARSPVGISLSAPGRVVSALTDASAERIRADRGDAAVEEYRALLMAPEDAAALMLEGAIARDFWMLPSRDSHAAKVRARMEELLAAEERDFERTV